jgi:hypothetical protein
MLGMVVICALWVARSRPASAADAGTTVTLEGGLRAASLGVDATARIPAGLVLGLGGGWARGPQIGAYAAYDVALGAHWSLRPGVRASRAWEKTNTCPTRCAYDFLFVEAGGHYQHPSGLTLDIGFPLAGLVPTGPSAGESKPHGEFNDVIRTPGLFLLSTVEVGYTF